MDRLALISGGGAGGGRVESRPRLPGDTDPAGLAQLEKAIRYLQGPKGVGDTLATLSQGQKELSEKIDNILNNFKDSDITGTLKDMAGNPVPKPGGGYWDHLKEMNDTLRGLRNHADTLKGVNEPSAQAARQRAVDTIDRIESALNGAGI